MNIFTSLWNCDEVHPDVHFASTILILESISYAIVVPIIPAMHRSLQLSTTTIGLLSSISSIIVLCCGIIQGRAADKYGKLIMLKLSTFAQIIGYICLLLAMIYSDYRMGYTLFLMARFIPGFFKCGMMMSQAYIVDRSASSSDNIYRISQLIAMSNAAGMIAPVLGGYLSTYSIRTPIIVAIAVSIINFMIIYMHQDNHSFHIKSSTNPELFKKPPTSLSDSKYHRCNGSIGVDFYEAIILKFIFQLGNMIYEAFYSQMLYDRLDLSSQSIGWLFGLSGIISSCTNAYLIPMIYHHAFHLPDILVLAAIAQAVGLWLWGKSHVTMSSALLSTIIVSMASNIFLTICQNCVAVSSSMQHRGSGTTLSYSSTVDRAARSIAPFIGGIALQQARTTSIGGIAAVSAITCSIMLFSKYSTTSLSSIPEVTTKKWASKALSPSIWKPASMIVKELGSLTTFTARHPHQH